MICSVCKHVTGVGFICESCGIHGTGAVSLIVQCNGEIYGGRCDECGAEPHSSSGYHTRTLDTVEQAAVLGYIRNAPRPPMPAILGVAPIEEPAEPFNTRSPDRWLYETPLGRVYVYSEDKRGVSTACFLLNTDSGAGWVDVGWSKGHPSEAAVRADRWLTLLQETIARGPQ